MALIVETGAVIPNANSYSTLIDAQAFLTELGLTDPAIDEPAMIRAYYYVNSFEDKYQGQRISADQTGSFPRSGMCINGFPLDSDAIPSQLIQAQAYAAYSEAKAPSSTTAQSNGGIVHEEVVGGVVRKFSNNDAKTGSFKSGEIDSLLSQLYSFSAGVIRTFRV